jgi:hypothetical protein
MQIITLLVLIQSITAASITGIVQGLTQKASGVGTVGDKCENQLSCQGSLICFQKVTHRHGRCGFAVAGEGETCNTWNEFVYSQNRCDFGLACIHPDAAQAAATPQGPTLARSKTVYDLHKEYSLAKQEAMEASVKNGVCRIKVDAAPLVPGLGEPCYLPLDAKHTQTSARSIGYYRRPNEGIPCKRNLACKVDAKNPTGLGRCFPPHGQKYVE